MRPAVAIVILALLWAAMTGAFTVPNLLFGAIIGIAATALLRTSLAPTGGLRRIRSILSLTLFFLLELLISAIQVAVLVLSPGIRERLRPAVVDFPLSLQSDAEIALLANLITLTPGTLSVDVSQDRTLLHIHVLHLGSREALIASIADGFEARIREVYA